MEFLFLTIYIAFVYFAWCITQPMTEAEMAKHDAYVEARFGD